MKSNNILIGLSILFFVPAAALRSHRLIAEAVGRSLAAQQLAEADPAGGAEADACLAGPRAVE